MRVAVAIQNGNELAIHFRQAEAFSVYEAQGGKIVREETRALEATEHGHGQVIRLLADCCAVVCGGLGHRAAEEFSQYGIEAVVAADAELPPASLAQQFVDGTLRRGTVHACCGHH